MPPVCLRPLDPAPDLSPSSLCVSASSGPCTKPPTIIPLCVCLLWTLFQSFPPSSLHVSASSGPCSRASHHHPGDLQWPDRHSQFGGWGSHWNIFIPVYRRKSKSPAELLCRLPCLSHLRECNLMVLNVKVSPLELPEAVIAYLILPWSSFVMAGTQLGSSPHGEMWQPHTLVRGRAWHCWNVKL